MTELLRDAAFGSLWHGCQWLAGLVLHLIGWPGVIAGLAGCLLLLSLSVKAVKFFNSPCGMGTTAVVLVASLVLVWWWWPQPAGAVASPMRELATHEPVPSIAAAPPQLLASVQARPEAIEAVRTAIVKPKPPPPAFPFMALAVPAPDVTPLPTPVITTHTLPPVVVGPNHPTNHPVHHATPRPALSQRSGGGYIPGRGYVAARGGGLNINNHSRPFQPTTINQLNNAAMHGHGPFAGGFGGVGGFGGGGGLGHMGGIAGMHGGMGHTGHMGHMGGHH